MHGARIHCLAANLPPPFRRVSAPFIRTGRATKIHTESPQRASHTPFTPGRLLLLAHRHERTPAFLEWRKNTPVPAAHDTRVLDPMPSGCVQAVRYVFNSGEFYIIMGYFTRSHDHGHHIKSLTFDVF